MIKKNWDKILVCLSILFAVVAIILLVAPGIALKSEYKDISDVLSAQLSAIYGTPVKVDIPKSYSMANITFGYSTTIAGVGTPVKFAFSFPNLLTYILIAGGIVCAVVALLGKGKKIVPFIAAGLFLVGGVLYLCAGKLLVLKTADSGYYTIGIGSILGGVFSILAACTAACVALVPLFIKK